MKIIFCLIFLFFKKMLYLCTELCSNFYLSDEKTYIKALCFILGYCKICRFDGSPLKKKLNVHAYSVNLASFLGDKGYGRYHQ